MNDTTSGVMQSPDCVMLRGFWYPALRSDQVRGKRMQKAMLLGEPLVLGRDSRGRAWALRDNCPHRGIPLSYGGFDGEQVECKYHGWRFDARTGQCRAIPSLTERDKLKVDRIYARHFQCEEHDRYFWVYLPDSADRDQAPPPVPCLPVFSAQYRFTQLASDLPTNIDHGIIGLMDPAHGPFVHQSWWWRARRSIYEKEKIFEPIPNGFRIRAHSPSANSAASKLLGIYGQP
jgi:phenylpropionate dioxygenase-like ring-hydroxylating dioxygenase large terminal subunit